MTDKKVLRFAIYFYFECKFNVKRNFSKIFQYILKHFIMVLFQRLIENCQDKEG